MVMHTCGLYCTIVSAGYEIHTYAGICVYIHSQTCDIAILICSCLFLRMFKRRALQGDLCGLSRAWGCGIPGVLEGIFRTLPFQDCWARGVERRFAVFFISLRGSRNMFRTSCREFRGQHPKPFETLA